MAKPLSLVNNIPTEVPAIATSAGAGDAGKLVEVGGDGRLHSSLMPVGIGADTKLIEASEALTAGDYVTIHNSGGARVRLADASDGVAGMAHGFVLDNVASGDDATLYFEGANPQLTGLTPGVTYALSHTTPGKVIALSAASTTAGHIVQELGYATEATEMNVEIGKPFVRG